MTHNRMALIVFTCTLCCTVSARAASVPLQSATASTSQFSLPSTIDGNANTIGWSRGDTVTATTYAVEAVSDVANSAGNALTFTIANNDTSFGDGHALGRFRLSYTTDSRTTFASGGVNASPGGTATWTVLAPLTFSSTNGNTTFTILGDNSLLLAGAVVHPLETYTVTAQSNATLTGITGFRIEALLDPSLPGTGPGRQAAGGNFIMSELSVNATALTSAPEPSSLLLIGLGLISLTMGQRRNKYAKNLSLR